MQEKCDIEGGNLCNSIIFCNFAAYYSNFYAMKSIREIFRIGYGPSSSHTMGPRKAAEQFLARNTSSARYEAHLYGSLSATGKGHLTDQAIIDVIPGVEIVWHEEFLPYHPNGMRFCAYDADGGLQDEWTVYSVGGGALSEGENTEQESKEQSIYPLKRLCEIKD